MGWLRSYALPLALHLRGHLEIYRTLHAHTLAKNPNGFGSKGKQGSLDLEA